MARRESMPTVKLTVLFKVHTEQVLHIVLNLSVLCWLMLLMHHAVYARRTAESHVVFVYFMFIIIIIIVAVLAFKYDWKCRQTGVGRIIFYRYQLICVNEHLHSF